ncbi:MAG: gliding motility-associated C-terminal domain-containing protein [Chitinophagales bacterium]|nr:gliding motility-associated C-terminal domain-containing protein [Chitinophagales bacterium]
MSRTSFSRVNTICPQQANQTTCTGGSLPGIEQHTYSGIITLPAQCSDWIISYDLCCRNSAITNLSNPGNYDLYIEARLNNSGGLCNNSPFFTTPPVPYVCGGSQTFYNHGAIDVDGDSLTYTLVNPLHNSGSNIPYRGGFSPTNPMNTQSGFGFTTSTGQMSFVPTGNQNAVVTVLVREYRNGVLIGTTMRDIQILVLNCNNAPPVMTGINGASGSVPANFTTRVCANTPVCFDINFSDANSNNLTVTWNNGIPGATFTVTPTQPPTARFCWTPTAADIGNNTFTVTVNDGACPIPGQAVRAFTIIVAPANYSLNFNTVNLTCPGTNAGSATVNAAGATPPITYQWSYNNASTQTISGIPGGVYTVTVTDVGGCGTTGSVTVTEPPAINVDIVTTPAVCNGAANGTASISVSGGTSPTGTYNWNWSVPGNANAPQISNLGSGWYYATVTDANNCTVVDSEFVFQPGPLIIVASASSTSNYNGAAISCTGAADGEITAVVSGGTLPYVYQWTANAGPQTDSVINNLAAGFYRVTITDANGCNTGTSATLTDPPPITSAATILSNYNGSPISCFGANDGRAQTIAAGGTGAYSYNWGVLSGNQNTSIATNLGPGTYTVTVSDANNCTTTDTLTLTEPPQLVINAQPITNYHGFNITCNGLSDGRALVNVSGGSPGYTYQWDDANAQQTDIAYDIPAGTYNVTVTDTNGCSATSQTTLIEPTPLTATANITSNYNGQQVSCFGAADGTANVTPGGGVAPYTYNWYPVSSSNPSVTGLAANTQYIAAVSDLNECYAYDTITLTEPAPVVTVATVTSNYNGQQISCFGAADGVGSANANGGVGPYTYTWIPAAPPYIAGIPTGLSERTYTIQATDANGCMGDTTLNVTGPPQIAITPSVVSNYNGQPISCYGAADGEIAVSATGGTGGFSYQWDAAAGGQTTANATNLQAGSYNVTVSDANSCTVSGNIIITQPALLVASAIVSSNYNGRDISCFGAADGAITANVTGGTAGYTFAWSNTQSSQTAGNLSVGNYSVSVTDANGCTANSSISLTQPNPVSVGASVTSNYNGQQVRCFGANDGTAAALATGGTGAYTYQWSPGNISGANASGLSANVVYTVLATDQNGCTAQNTLQLTGPTSVTATAAVVSNYNGRDISCFNANDGAASVAGSGGTPPYTFQWDPSAGGVINTVAGALRDGTYNVSVTDANNCRAVTSVTLTHPPQILPTASVLTNYNGYNVSCFGRRDGRATVSTVNGGTAPYQYLWDINAGGAQTQIASGLAAGNYDVTITDINNCSSTARVSLTEPQELLLASTTTPIVCHGLQNATIKAESQGGVPVYTYSWSSNAGIGNVDIANHLGPGTYDVTVTDANNCTASKSESITEPDPINISLDRKNPTCYQGSDGNVSASVIGGVPSYEYQWNNGAWATDGSAQGLASGKYVLVMRDANGCTVSDSLELVDPLPITLNVTPEQDTIIYGNEVQLTSEYGTTVPGPITYQWQPTYALSCTDCPDPIANPLFTTEYTLSIADANGCKTEKTVLVYIDEELRPFYVPNAFTPNSNGINDKFLVYASGVKEMELKVYDRWGELVFQSSDINSGWDGTYKGEPLTPNTFVYTAKVVYLDGKEKSAKGSVTLLR